MPGNLLTASMALVATAAVAQSQQPPARRRQQQQQQQQQQLQFGAILPRSPPPPQDCPKCCFELIGDSGCPGSFDCNDCPMGLDDFVNVKRDFGAVGNYGVDDTLPIQKAINFCKKTQRGLLFPSGTYVVTSPLDFGAWNGIFVTGGVPGANGIAGSGATVQLQANLNKTEGACFDFSGSAYGSVSGIAFGGKNCQVTVLNARTCCQSTQDQNRSTGSIYGSDLTYERCNFAGGSVAAFANHMGEVITWRDCRFHDGGHRPGVLITWRLDQAPWNVAPMHGRNFTHGVTLTMYRMYGGEVSAAPPSLLHVWRKSGSDFCLPGLLRGSQHVSCHVTHMPLRWKFCR